jgi:hypothetical protein
MTSSSLLGREQEVNALHALLEGAPERGATLLPAGEPGIGKSALLAAFGGGRRAGSRPVPDRPGDPEPAGRPGRLHPRLPPRHGMISV